jgi:hypothetical protein
VSASSPRYCSACTGVYLTLCEVYICNTTGIRGHGVAGDLIAEHRVKSIKTAKILNANSEVCSSFRPSTIDSLQSVDNKAYVDARTSHIEIEAAAFNNISADVGSAAVWNSGKHSLENLLPHILSLSHHMDVIFTAAYRFEPSLLVKDCLFSSLGSIGHIALSASDFAAVKEWKETASVHFAK